MEAMVVPQSIRRVVTVHPGRARSPTAGRCARVLREPGLVTMRYGWS